MDSSQNYSKVTDGGTSSSGRVNSSYFTLYLDDTLVSEWTSSSQTDTYTGLEPCPAGGGGGVASLRPGAKSAPVPLDYALVAAPNPARSNGQVRFDLPRAGSARIRISDLNGASVANLDQGVLGAGSHQVPVEIGRMANGIYFVSLETNEGVGWVPRRVLKWALAR
jgi:hypothetical protein